MFKYAFLIFLFYNTRNSEVISFYQNDIKNIYKYLKTIFPGTVILKLIINKNVFSQFIKYSKIC